MSSVTGAGRAHGLRSWHRHVAFPVVRLPRSRQSNACIRIIDHHARALLLWPRHLAAAGTAPDSRQIQLRDRWLHLVVSILFRPARFRIQSVIDQRFNRTRYDAARALESFSMRLRDEIDLGSLEKELLAVVHETMRPANASLLLLSPAKGHPGDQTPSAGRPSFDE